MMSPIVLVIGSVGLIAAMARGDDLRPVPPRSAVAEVQPMTGIVLWATNPAVRTAPIQLEYSYMTYDRIVRNRGEYDWSALEKLLDEVAGRRHQLVLRWHDTYVARPTGVPAYIKALPDYRETTAKSEGKSTGFPDWSHPEWQRFVPEFFDRFAERYDRDPRLAFVEVSFGLWAEYHIYDGPMKLGGTFPTRAYQADFARHLGRVFRQTPWMVSVDAAQEQGPFGEAPDLLALPFGLFDDSFNHRDHARVNEPNWNLLGRDRWKLAPTGGEFSFYEPKDQTAALGPAGPHGTRFEDHAARFHISWMIGDAQPRHQKPDRIRSAGMACGYRFRVAEFRASASRAEGAITNTGIAPIYYDAFPAVAGVRSATSLKGLLPGETRRFVVEAGISDKAPGLTIECDRLVPGQRIGFDADLP